jgi:hypothetical protein
MNCFCTPNHKAKEGAEELTISALYTFACNPHTAREYAEMGLPGYPATKAGMFCRLYGARVKRYPSQGRGGGYVFWFRDLPSRWQADIVVHFIRHNRTESIPGEVSRQTIDEILQAYATEDKLFALKLRRRKEMMEEVSKRIEKLIDCMEIKR